MPSRLRSAVLLLALALAGAGCSLVQADGPVQRGPGQAPQRLSAARDVHGIHPTLTAPIAAERARVRSLIAGVRLGRRSGKGSYDRAAFGPAWTDDVDVTWGRNGCRTRDDILRRDVRAATLRPGTEDRDGRDCVVLEGLLDDPYTGRLIEFSRARATEVQIDHVVPLAYAWQLGARDWTAEKRQRFANDPLNLLAVDGPANQQKGAAGPNSWLPRNKPIRCAYAVRIARVARRYALPMTTFDRDRLTSLCAKL